jgi:hypothetical protein
MLNELDGLPLGPADQSGEPSLALDQRQVAQRCRTWIGVVIA